MPAQELSHRFQKAILWEAAGVDSYGNIKVLAPVELTVRWNTKRTESVDAQGLPIMLDATVHVIRTIPVGSIMWRGELDEWYGTGSGDTTTELMEVKNYNETPDLKNRVRRRTIGLMKFRSTLPSLSTT